MEPLKGCTSNVHVLKDIDTTHYRLYVCQDPAPSHRQRIANTITHLRGENEMCTAIGNRIWIFYAMEQEDIDSQISGFRLESRSTIAEHNQTLNGSEQSIITTFLHALEGSITFALSRAHNAVRLSAWTWLLPDSEMGDCGIEAHMQLQLADDWRKLNIATVVRTSELARLTATHTSEISDVVIAPSGMFATLFVEESVGVGSGKAEDLTFAVGDEQWKASVREALATESLTLSPDADWLDVVLCGTREAVCWPKSLCFARRRKGMPNTRNECCVDDWRSWFELSDVGSYEDPLSFAEEWITSYTERELQPHNFETIRNDDLTTNDNQSVQTQMDSTTFDVTSPPLTNRPDLQALHGIYPTPPDGLAAHNVPQLQPHSESVVGPGVDPVQAPNFMPSDPAPENSVSLFDGVPDAEGEQLPRNHSIVSSIGPHAQDWNRGSTDDLFGDMDDMEYAREEVGDADFNFFDEPDIEPVKDNAQIRYGTASDADMQRNVSLHEATAVSDAQLSAEPSTTEDSMQLDEQEHASPEQIDRHQDEEYVEPTRQEELLTPGVYNVKAQRSDDVKPLSPFGIKEALLPPPIPASAIHGSAKIPAERRRSSFGPLAFNSGNNLASRSSVREYSDFRPDDRKSSYDLGPTRVPLTTVSESSASSDTSSSLGDAESEFEVETDNENDSSSIISETHLVADAMVEERANLATKKRKRTLDSFSYCGPQSAAITQADRHEQRVGFHGGHTSLQGDDVHDLISKLLGGNDDSDFNTLRGLGTAPGLYNTPERRVQGHPSLDKSIRSAELGGSIEPNEMDNLSSSSLTHVLRDMKLGDLVRLGQIVSEQAVTVVRSIALEAATIGYAVSDDMTNEQRATFRNLDATLETIALRLSMCDISSLALVREPLPIQRPQASQANAGIASQARQPPRPPARVDPTVLGPDILPLMASFVRANRSESSWEMAPTALAFWEALGLSPASGSKDIRLFCIAPDNTALEDPVAEYLRNLKAAYEGCKFGSMAIGIEIDNTSPREHVDYLHPVTFESATAPSLHEAMQAYWLACSILGSELAEIAFDEPHRTLVVSMISPFSSATNAEWATISQYLSACFLNLSKSYHNAATQGKRYSGTELAKRQISDIDFKIIPVDIVASPSGVVVLSAQQMALLARELYDRCPPASDASNESSPLSNAAAPSVELVEPLPKRIGFQLTPDPPSDLLHEASVLHVAFATSRDSKWTNVVWHDNTGRYANSSALCMQGRSFANIALEVWQRTMELTKAREVIWRIFITAAGGDGLETSRANCWKDIISQHTDRKQLLSVTLLHFQPELALSITPPSDTAPGPGSSAPTPAATPQPGSGQAISTTSPDATSGGNAPVTAPPTPAPSEAASSILEADPDAHLIETEDETWCMLIDRDVASTLRPSKGWPESVMERPIHIAALSHGVLIKRGKTSDAVSSFAAERPYPCAGASLIWTLRVRPKSDRQGGGERPNVDEGSARHAEVMLREVLGMYRNLGLLSKVKGLDPSGLVPVHVIAAIKGAEGLNGLLRGHGKLDVE
jgi:mediator of RNA polymerase II transcription subunit 13